MAVSIQLTHPIPRKYLELIQDVFVKLGILLHDSGITPNPQKENLRGESVS